MFIKMDKRGNSETLWNNVIYLILLALVVAGLFVFINNQMNGGAVWEDYYAKEIVKMINLAQPGDKLTIDVQKATKIAKKNHVESFNDIFLFNEKDKEVCVRLSEERRTCYGYFNDVSIKNNELRLGRPGNSLYFEIEDGGKDE